MSFKFKPVGYGAVVGAPDLYDIYDTAPAGLKVGSKVRGIGVNGEEAEFVLLFGTASLGVGAVVTYNGFTGVVNRSPAANSNGPVAVSLTANTNPAKLSFFQITGNAVANVGNAAAGSLLWHNVAGALFVTPTAGKQILGAVCATVGNPVIDGVAVGALNAIICLHNGATIQGQIT